MDDVCKCGHDKVHHVELNGTEVSFHHCTECETCDEFRSEDGVR